MVAAAAALRSIPQTSRSGVRVSLGLDWLHQHCPRPSVSSGSQLSPRKFLYHTDKQCLDPCFLTVRVPCGLETGYTGLAHGSRWGHRLVSYFPGSVYSIPRFGNFCTIACSYPLVSPVGSASACSTLSPLLCLNMCL